ncbi:hypothetical protein BDZ91DRAFT_288761 [Kalaharituber pfeilii]|nr:hypothetical protein BDZ91DRAFT_288761 [Kalaharituber pfeilii]
MKRLTYLCFIGTFGYTFSLQVQLTIAGLLYIYVQQTSPICNIIANKAFGTHAPHFSINGSRVARKTLYYHSSHESSHIYHGG